MLANSVIDLIGNTPLVKINNINTFGNEIYVKLEGSNPGRSTKDRIALKMIEEAEKEGLIDKDTVGAVFEGRIPDILLRGCIFLGTSMPAFWAFSFTGLGIRFPGGQTDEH